MVHQPAAHDLRARRSGEVVLEVVGDPIALPEGERSHEGRRVGKFGDDRVVNVDGFSEMTNQRLKELLPGAASRSFNHRLQRAKVVANIGTDRYVVAVRMQTRGLSGVQIVG